MAVTGPSRLGPLYLRVAAGAIFMYHGYEKCITNNVSEFVAKSNFGLPYNDILSQVAAWGELVGGGLLILGLATRVAALVNLGTMAVAIWFVHLGNRQIEDLKNLKEYEFQLALFAICLSLIFLGGGAMSVDGFIAGKKGHAPPSHP